MPTLLSDITIKTRPYQPTTFTIKSAADHIGYALPPKDPVHAFMREKVREVWQEAGWGGLFYFRHRTGINRILDSKPLFTILAVLGCVMFLMSMVGLLDSGVNQFLIWNWQVAAGCAAVAVTARLAYPKFDNHFGKIYSAAFNTRWVAHDLIIEHPPSDVPAEAISICNLFLRVVPDGKFRIFRLCEDPWIEMYNWHDGKCNREFIYGYDGPHRLVYDGKKIVALPRSVGE